ncbi:hypothetical protein [Qaidamihabitans albus]|uniref:hypothetical protein n=1 Tax=Qaidamihabitans albus TaxID=2795733 RepID=UPI0018F1D621|nr:hypothetical protein [Qaidamihabitans albus]
MSGQAAVMCSVCGDRQDPEDEMRALTWVRENDQGRARWLCPRCASRHVRDIESKLPVEYW